MGPDPDLSRLGVSGIPATFLYNYFANLLRAIGNSVTPLLFLGVSVVGNIGLDLLFVIPLKMGVMGAALATVLAQYARRGGPGLWTWQSCRTYGSGRKTGGGTGIFCGSFGASRSSPACNSR